MKSLNRAFLIQSQQSPNHSSYICLLRAVRGKKLTRRSISSGFDRLVDPDDYDLRDRNSLVAHLYAASQEPLSENSPVSSKKRSDKRSTALTSSECSQANFDPKSAVVEGFLSTIVLK